MGRWLILHKEFLNKTNPTVLPAKSDRDFMFSLQSYQGLKIVDSTNNR